LTFNVEQFETASFDSAITGIPILPTNPMSDPGRVEVVRNIDQVALDTRQIEKISESDLVNILHKTIVTHCKIIDGLV
jgi:hypothetical protein